MAEVARAEIDPFGNTVTVNDVVLRTPGLSGTVIISIPDTEQNRAVAFEKTAFAQVLDKAEIKVEQYIELTDISAVAIDNTILTRTTATGDIAIEIDVPELGEAFGQILYVSDENRNSSWHFPVVEKNKKNLTRTTNKLSYLIPSTVANVKTDTNTRGLIGKLGRKFIQVLSFKLLDPIIGKISNYFMKKWEEKYRAHELRSFTMENYQLSINPDISVDTFTKLSSGPSLLFIHGAFSRAHSAFGELPAALMQQLINKYDGRVFALNHSTVSVDPTENAQWFINQLPEDISLTLDIVCHSRGGLVSRVLSEHQDSLILGSRTVNIRKIIFVASPNNGTKLADPIYLNDLIDTYTNALSLLPDNTVTDMLEVIVSLVKEISVITLTNFSGLQAMNPKGKYLKEFLNAHESTVETDYHAICANFEPMPDNLKMIIADRLFDRIFSENNDLVVPTIGVYQDNNSPNFPIKSKIEFGTEDNIQHLSFFSNDKVGKQLIEWLK